jgi:putative hemolysin
MISLIVFEITALLVLLALSAFFSSAETAFFSLNPVHIHRIRRSKPGIARAIETLLATPTHLLSTLLIGNTLVNVVVASVAFVIADQIWPGYGAPIAIPSMTLLLIVFGEVLPKRLAVRHPEPIASYYLRPIGFFITLLTPLRRLLEWITRSLETSFKPRRRALSGQDLMTVVDVSHTEGVLNPEERAMVDGILRLENIQARDVMTPRVDLIGIDINGNPDEYVALVRKYHFHYLPVFRDSLDHIEGFLDVPKFLLAPLPDLQAAMLPHFYVPDTATLDALLTTFHQQNRRLAIVIDEYGGTAGMITRGDILDEIAESVSNEFGGSNPDIQPQGVNRWIVNGNTSIEEVNYELDLHLEAEGVDRIAGWFTYHTEHVPRLNEVLEIQSCRATAKEVKKHRITYLLIERLEPSDSPAVDEEPGAEL